MYCFSFQKFEYFVSECNVNKKEPQENEARVARQEYNSENTLGDDN